MANANAILEIGSLAQTSCEPGVAWHFLPLGKILLKGEDKGILLGRAFYKNTLFEFGPSLKMYDWMFMMERKTAVLRHLLGLTGPNPWSVCAFNGQRHYTFVAVGDVNDLSRALVLSVVKMFWKWLYPGIPFPDEDEYMKLQFSPHEFDKEIIMQNIYETGRLGFTLPG